MPLSNEPEVELILTSIYFIALIGYFCLLFFSSFKHLCLKIESSFLVCWHFVMVVFPQKSV